MMDEKEEMVIKNALYDFLINRFKFEGEKEEAICKSYDTVDQLFNLFVQLRVKK